MYDYAAASQGQEHPRSRLAGAYHHRIPPPRARYAMLRPSNAASLPLHAFMRHGADELASILPRAQRRTLEGQDHGPADAALVPALKEFFLG